MTQSFVFTLYRWCMFIAHYLLLGRTNTTSHTMTKTTASTIPIHIPVGQRLGLYIRKLYTMIRARRSPLWAIVAVVILDRMYDQGFELITKCYGKEWPNQGNGKPVDDT